MNVKQKMIIGKWNIKYREHNDSKWHNLIGKNKFWYADPMLFNYKNKKYLFVEAFDERIQLGKIAVSEYKNNKFEIPQIALVRPYHLSYPSVFEWKGNIYMLPETSQNRTVELYISEDDTMLHWKRKCILIKDKKFVDITVIKNKETIILYAYEESKEKYITHIFSLDIDKKCVAEIGIVESEQNDSRPAGNIFEYKNKRYRPLQISTSSYGEYMKIKEFTDFLLKNERDICFITPDNLCREGFEEDTIRTHTIAYDQDVEIIDYLVEDISWTNIIKNYFRRSRNGIYKIKAGIKWMKN